MRDVLDAQGLSESAHADAWDANNPPAKPLPPPP